METDPHWACPQGFLKTQFPPTQRAEPQTWEKPVQTQRFSVGWSYPLWGNCNSLGMCLIVTLIEDSS